MRPTDPFLSVVDAYAGALGLEDKTVSSRVFKDSAKIPDMRKGADITVTRMAKALEWFSANWPEGAEWPSVVDRPRSDEAAA